MSGSLHRIDEAKGSPSTATERAIRSAQSHLLSIQRDDGHWCGELEGDTILGSEYILAMHFLGRSGEGRVRKAASYVRQKQIPEGGWAIYPGGPAEVSASVKAYLVLKLVGDRPDEPHMVRARRKILELGGIEACNSFTKLYLAIFGQYSWDRCPAIPPEIILLPRWFYINIYEISSWSRAIVVPLSVIWSSKPSCPMPEHARIAELRTDRPAPAVRTFWSTVFHGIDRGLKLLEKLPVKPSRELALQRAESWILTRLEDSDGLGAIFPPIVNTIMALRCLGYPIDHPTVRRQVRELEKLEIEEGDTLRVQPCFSPVWDTAMAANALIESGMPSDDPRLLRAARWLLDRRGNGSGDWRFKNTRVARPGWFFEYANPFYPDNDTTAKVLTTLGKVRFPQIADEGRRRSAVREAGEWLLSMQNRDGGWGAFDKDCSKHVLTHVPFADHNAMIDPSNEDITARVLETLVGLGFDRSHPAARRAIDYLLCRQEEDGSWYGRWGCNYLYGTWLTLWGLRCIGEDLDSAWGRQASCWLRACQNEDGGWGELPLSYEDATQKGRGPSTASQTAWALMGLLAAGEWRSDSVRRGVEFLVREQRDDGSWSEEYWTGTGFPCVFYLRYHLYGIYFPLLALSYYEQCKSGELGHRTRPARLSPAHAAGQGSGRRGFHCTSRPT
jgi:squalene-hopene/tetraprenyl-beta-curcumene cyclase